MIKTITMKSCPPFDEAGAEIAECKQINFIYGANGSGKTTISEFLREQNRDSERYASSSIEWESGAALPIHVYNRKFIELNFNQEKGIPGVFTLGQDAIEDQRAIDSLKSESEELVSRLNSVNGSIQKQEEEKGKKEAKLSECVWNQIYKNFGVNFEKAFDRFRNNKKNFLGEFLRRVDNPQGSLKDERNLLERAKSLFNREPKPLSLLNVPTDEAIDKITEECGDDIWQEVIVGSKDVDISGLINELNNSSWVRQGVKFLEKTGDVCPFCQKRTVDDSFREQLRCFFNTEFMQKVERLKTKLMEIQNIIAPLISDLKKNLEKNDEIELSQLNQELYETQLENLETQLENTKYQIEKKINAPETKIDISELAERLIAIRDTIKEANERIKTNNRLVDKFDEEYAELVDDVWFYCIKESEASIRPLYKSVQDAKKAIIGMNETKEALEKKIKEKQEEINQRLRNVTSIRPAVEYINNTLKLYGFSSFHMEPYSDGGAEQLNKYRVVRDDGTSASENLSEGESTFITFLYFMQLTRGAIQKDKTKQNKVIVLDDPISSLDSGILYLVSTMVKDLARDIKSKSSDVKQLFVLTHNVYFHKESSFIDGRTKKDREVNYWIIRKNEGVSKVCAYEMENPILSSYELLWKELKEDKFISQVSLQNTMRRIIENYFRLSGSKREDFLLSQFETSEEKSICKSLLCWINDGSHCIYDDIHIDQYSDAKGVYRKVFRDIFDKSGNLAHYNMMMEKND